jgi:hypothetical protein
VARAKRTDRAEARRRYRAQLAADGGEELDPADDVEPAPQSQRPVRQPARRGAAEPADMPARPGIGNAFRSAFRPPNVGADLAALPQLLRHRSVWLPALISIGTTAVLLTTRGSDGISLLVYQYFVLTPPIGAIFLSGFLAPRASYITGAIAGLVGAACLAVLVAAFPAGNLGGPAAPAASPSPSALTSPAASGSPATSAAASASAPASAAASGSPAPSAAVSPGPSPAPTAAGSVPTPDELAGTVAASFLLSPLTGALFGAAAAWYRRFLNLANPNRGTRRPPPKGKPRRR